jgi:hypothetical protein
MMSTAMVIAIGGEQTNTHSAVSDRVGDEGMSFAQTFGERVGLSTDGQVKSATRGAMGTLGERKDEVPIKSSEEPSVSTGAGSKALIGKGARESSDAEIKSRDGLAAKSFITLSATPGGKLSKNADESLPVKDGRLQNTVAKSAKAAVPKPTVGDSTPVEDELSTGKMKEAAEKPVTMPNSLMAGSSKEVELTPKEGAAGSDRLPVTNVHEESLVRQGKSLESNHDVASAKKKIEKTNSASGLKTAGIIEGSKKAEAQPAGATDMAGADVASGAASVSGQMQPSGDGQGIDSGKTVVSGEVASAGGSVAAGASTATDVSRAAGIAGAGRSDGADTDGTLNLSASQADPAGSEKDIAKPDVASAPVGRDGNGRTSGVVTAATHPDEMGSAAVAGAGPGVMFGHALTDAVGVKTQAGEAVAHATSLHAGLAEQDGAGAVDGGGVHGTLTATPTSLEVGVANGTQGWLKIRAEMTGGGLVNASLSSATPAGQEMLHRELPGLTAYLHQERVTVSTVVVHAPASAAVQPEGGMGADQRGQMQQEHTRGGEEGRQEVEGIASDRVDDAVANDGLSGLSESGLLSSGMFAGGGGYLNVRA